MLLKEEEEEKDVTLDYFVSRPTFVLFFGGIVCMTLGLSPKDNSYQMCISIVY